MQTFGKFIIVACVALLTWRQSELHVRSQAETGGLVAVAVDTMVLTCTSRRSGYALAVLMGLGYLAELMLMIRPPAQLVHLQPLFLWSGALIVCGALLLWSSREPRKREPG